MKTMFRNILLIMTLSLLPFSIFAAPSNLPTYDPETEVPVLKEDLKRIEENARTSLEEASKLNLQIDKAKVQIEVLEYKLDLYHANFDSQMNAKFWQGFALGSGAVVVVAGLGALGYLLLR